MGMVFKRIFNGGIQERPFKAHKRYEVTDVNYSSSFEISVLRGISDNGILTEVSTSVQNQIAVGPNVITGSGAATYELNSIPQTIVWNSLNSTFFKRRTDVKLYNTASIVSIPQNKFGDGIKPGSVYISDSSNYPSSIVSLYDQKVNDEYGLLIVNELTSSSYPNSGDILVNLNFKNNKVTDGSMYSTLNRIIQNGDYSVSEMSNLNIGNIYHLNHSSSVQITNQQHFDILNKVDDWSVTFWANIPISQSLNGVTEQTLVQKRNAQRYYDSNGLEVTRKLDATRYPFDIGFYTENDTTNVGHIYVKSADGPTTRIMTSSAEYNDGSFHNYALVKSGSLLTLFVDGVADNSMSYSFRNPVTNYRDIVIGSGDTTLNTGFSGSIANFQLHQTALSNNVIQSISDNSPSGSALLRREAGYVFYKHGMVVVSDPRPRYQNIFLGDGNWNYTNRPFQLNYRATKTVEEISVLCELEKNEFNVSSNSSLRLTSNEYDPRLKPMITGSDFRPYITQVGLYNDSGDLLAIAKLGSPLKKRQDVDVTINVRFDID